MLTSAFEVNHSLGSAGVILFKTPSPLFTFSPDEGVLEGNLAGGPVPCAPPSKMFKSLDDWENATNCVSDPKVWFRLSNWLLKPHVPAVSPVKPSRAR